MNNFHFCKLIKAQLLICNQHIFAHHKKTIVYILLKIKCCEIVEAYAAEIKQIRVIVSRSDER